MVRNTHISQICETARQIIYIMVRKILFTRLERSSYFTPNKTENAFHKSYIVQCIATDELQDHL